MLVKSVKAEAFFEFCPDTVQGVAYAEFRTFKKFVAFFPCAQKNEVHAYVSGGFLFLRKGEPRLGPVQKRLECGRHMVKINRSDKNRFFRSEKLLIEFIDRILFLEAEFAQSLFVVAKSAGNARLQKFSARKENSAVLHRISDKRSAKGGIAVHSRTAGKNDCTHGGFDFQQDMFRYAQKRFLSVHRR